MKHLSYATLICGMVSILFVGIAIGDFYSSSFYQTILAEETVEWGEVSDACIETLELCADHLTNCEHEQ